MQWQETDAGPELDRAVAERLGWQVRTLVPGRQVRYQLIRPDGTVEGTYNAERDAWLQVPKYSIEPRLSLALAEQIEGSFMLRRAADGLWQAEITTAGGQTYTGGAGSSRPALAIVRAWLAWRAEA